MDPSAEPPILGLKIPKGQRPKVKSYDFTKPDKFSWDQIHTLELIHDNFSRLAGTYLSNCLKTQVQVIRVTVDQMTYQEFLDQVQSSTLYTVCQLDPLKNYLLWAWDLSAMKLLLNTLFGGSGQGTTSETSEFPTELEHKALDVAEEGLQRALAEAFSPILPQGKGKVITREHQAQFVQIVPPLEMVISVSFRLKLGETEGQMNLALPYLTLEPLMGLLSTNFWIGSPYRIDREFNPWAQRLSRQLPFRVELAWQGEPLSLKDLSQLKKGSRIPLKVTPTGPELKLMRGQSVLFPLNVKDPGAKILDLVLEATNPFLSEAENPSQAVLREIRALKDSLKPKAKDIVPSLSPGANTQEKSTAAPSPFDGLLASLNLPQDLEHLADVLREVRPQTLSWILAQLPPSSAGRILGLQEPQRQVDCAQRLTCLGSVNSQVLSRIEAYLGEILARDRGTIQQKREGVDLLTEILSHGPRDLEKTVVEALDALAPELAQAIKDRLFTFEDLILLEEGSLCWCLEQWEIPLLCQALQGTNESFRSSLVQLMTAPRRRELETCLGRQTPLRMHQIQEARNSLIESLKVWEIGPRDRRDEPRSAAGLRPVSTAGDGATQPQARFHRRNRL